jgi:hypothetical protein
MEPNSRDVAATTTGIARNLSIETQDTPSPQGGGNLNGSANVANLLGQAGNIGGQAGMPRRWAANYCGTV